MKPGWRIVKLKDVCSKITDGSHNPPQGIDSSDFIMLSSKNVFDDHITLEKPRFLTESDFQAENRRTEVCYNDVLLTVVGTVGRAAIVPEGFPPITLQRSVAVLKPQFDVIVPRFLMFALHSVSEVLIDGARGVAQKGIYLNALREIQIPIPPLEEQQRIVAFLDESFEGLDRARANAEANLQNARELFGIQISSAFNDIDNDSVATLTVEDLADSRKGSIRTGPFGSQLLHSEFTKHGIAVLGIDNAVQNEFRWSKHRYISAEKYTQLKRYKVYPGDVIITIMGTCGRCAVVPEDIPTAINTKHLCCITPDRNKCLPEYLHCYFLHAPAALEYLSRNASGSVMDGLNMGLIKALPVQLPSIDKQREIVQLFCDAKNAAQIMKSNYDAKLKDLDGLRQSLLQKAFAGELT